MKPSKRQQRLRNKFLSDKGLNEAGKIVYQVEDVDKHINKNLRPSGPFANKPFVRKDNPELLNDRGKLATNYITKYPMATRSDRRIFSDNRNDIHQIIEAHDEYKNGYGEIVKAKPRKIIHHNPAPIKRARAEFLTYGFHALKP